MNCFLWLHKIPSPLETNPFHNEEYDWLAHPVQPTNSRVARYIFGAVTGDLEKNIVATEEQLCCILIDN